MKVGDFFESIEENYRKAVKIGCGNSTDVYYLKIYMDFKKLTKKLPIMQCYSELSEKYKVSEKTIRNAVARMKKII